MNTRQLAHDRMIMNYPVDVEFADESHETGAEPVEAAAARRAAHDVSGQLRQLKGTHEGGQFARTLDGRVIDAVEKWLAGDHEPLTGFGTVQLRKVIERRGLPKPAPRTSAAAMRRTLVDDVRDNGAGVFGAGPVIELAASPRDLSRSLTTRGEFVTPAGRKALDSLGAAGHPRIAAIPDTEGKIREAYRMLSIPGSSGYVGLADVRKLIGEQALRADVDTTLKRMYGLPDVHLVPQEGARTNAATRMPAALMMGGGELDMIRIDDPRLARPQQFSAVSMAEELDARRSGGGRDPMMALLSDADLRAEIDARAARDPMVARDLAARESDPLAALRAATSRADAEAMLKGHTKAQLQDVARELQVPFTTRATKSTLTAMIVDELGHGDAATSLAGRVEQAILAKRRRGEWFGVADLRDALPDVPRDELDATLKEMLREDKIRLIPVANSKALKPRDWAAAVRIGDDENTAIMLLGDSTSSASPTVAPTAVADQIAALSAGRDNKWVSLTELRPTLGGTKAEQDAALLDLLKERRIILVPESNQKMLTEADRAAAIRVGGGEAHLVMIAAAALRFGGGDNHVLRIDPAPGVAEILQERKQRRELAGISDNPTEDEIKQLLNGLTTPQIKQLYRDMNVEIGGRFGVRPNAPKSVLVDNLYQEVVGHERRVFGDDRSGRLRLVDNALEIKPPERSPVPYNPPDGLDELADHQLRSLATEFEIPGARDKSRTQLITDLRAQDAKSPYLNRTPSPAPTPATARPAGDPVRTQYGFDAGPATQVAQRTGRTTGDEPLYVPNGGADQGLLHLDSQLGTLWADLVTDRREPNSTVNEIARIGERVGVGQLSLDEAADRLRQLSADAPDEAVARRIDKAINGITEPGPLPVIDLPDNVPPKVRAWVEQLAQIPTLRKTNIPGNRRDQSVLDEAVDIVRKVSENPRQFGRPGEAERRLELLTHNIHESVDGVYQARRLTAKTFGIGSPDPETRAWFRGQSLPTKAAPAGKRSPAEILAGLDPNLTAAQKRARLRSAGVDKAEIDRLVPLAKKTTSAKTPAFINETSQKIDEQVSELAIIHLLAQDSRLTAANLKKLAAQLGIDPPNEGLVARNAWQHHIAATLAKRRGLPGPTMRRAADVSAAAGHDVTPGHDELHHYWTLGKGRRLWVDSPKPWTTLYGLLAKIPEVGPIKAKVFASRWFFEVKGYYAGSDLNRVAHGKPPRGHRIGPG